MEVLTTDDLRSKMNSRSRSLSYEEYIKKALFATSNKLFQNQNLKELQKLQKRINTRIELKTCLQEQGGS